MLPDALPQLIDKLLHLRLLDAAQLRELIQHLPDPQASAREMVRRGWITQDQFSSLFPGPQHRPTPRETLLIGFGDDAVAPDADGGNWDLTVSDEEDQADVPPEVEWPDPIDEEVLAGPETAEAVPVLSGAASTPQFEWSMLGPPAAGGNGASFVPAAAGGIAARRPATDPDKLLMRYMGWASKGLLVWALFVGSYFAGLQVFGAKPKAPPMARRASSVAKKKLQVPAARPRVPRPPITPAKADKAPENEASPYDNPDLPLELRAANYNAKLAFEVLKRKRKLEEERQRQMAPQRMAKNARRAVPAAAPQAPPADPYQQVRHQQMMQRNRQLQQAVYQQQAMARQQMMQMQQPMTNPWWLSIQQQQLQVIGFPR